MWFQVADRKIYGSANSAGESDCEVIRIRNRVPLARRV
jgi:hypothetical protein